MLKLTDKDDFFVQNVFEIARKQNNEIILELLKFRLIFRSWPFSHYINFIVFCIRRK